MYSMIRWVSLLFVCIINIQLVCSSQNLVKTEQGSALIKETSLTSNVQNTLEIKEENKVSVVKDNKKLEDKDPKKECAEFIPYQAEYSIELDKKANIADQDSVLDVKGNLTTKLTDGGDKWISEQRSEVQVYYEDGSFEQIITTIATWESKNGEDYRFYVRTLRSNGAEEIMSGQAFAPKGLIGSVTFEQPEKQRFDLPIGTIFPLTHLKQVIEAAMVGENVLPNRIVFDGSSEGQEPVDVNVVIGAAQDPKLILHNQPELLQANKAWTLQIAVFSRNSKNAEPEFEMQQKVLPNGIITSMIMDNGPNGVTTKLTLNKIEIFPVAKS